ARVPRDPLEDQLQHAGYRQQADNENDGDDPQDDFHEVSIEGDDRAIPARPMPGSALRHDVAQTPSDIPENAMTRPNPDDDFEYRGYRIRIEVREISGEIDSGVYVSTATCWRE